MSNNMMWKVKSSNKRKASQISCEEYEEENTPLSLPFQLPKLNNTSVYSDGTHVYFNDDISRETAFILNKELRAIDQKLKYLSIHMNMNLSETPIYLHITTNGGEIDAAFSIIDCMNGLTSPVYTVVDGFVASAGTIIILAGKKRYMQPNAYFLIHQLSSGVWGKMQEIKDEYANLTKLTKHLVNYYVSNTKMRKSEVEQQLQQDITWNVREVIARGMVDEVYKN